MSDQVTDPVEVMIAIQKQHGIVHKGHYVHPALDIRKYYTDTQLKIIAETMNYRPMNRKERRHCEGKWIRESKKKK